MMIITVAASVKVIALNDASTVLLLLKEDNKVSATEMTKARFHVVVYYSWVHYANKVGNATEISLER